MGRRRSSFNPGPRRDLSRVNSRQARVGARMRLMAIHQIQLRYEPAADRLLMQVRSTEAELYAVWLTRRMAARLYPPFRDAVARAGVARLSPQAMPVPEAREMLEQAAWQRPLPGTDFQKPFVDAGGSHPLGPDPLLPAVIDLRPTPSGGVVIALREERGRRLELSLTAELATALLRLLDASLRAADWGLPDLGPTKSTAASAAASAAPQDGADATDPTKARLLN